MLWLKIALVVFAMLALLLAWFAGMQTSLAAGTGHLFKDAVLHGKDETERALASMHHSDTIEAEEWWGPVGRHALWVGVALSISAAFSISSL